ncbi:MAG: hypothetical protein HC852_06745 [Acaryochloridaceae cyanobacterium RU_4_10]|nr:hypothetical protein [Acaryochloridaceae cyanobacterium RU_4_10]
MGTHPPQKQKRQYKKTDEFNQMLFHIYDFSDRRPHLRHPPTGIAHP